MIELYNGDCGEVLQNINKTNAIIVTDPPFNVGYKYATYNDRMETGKYYDVEVSYEKADLNGAKKEYPVFSNAKEIK